MRISDWSSGVCSSDLLYSAPSTPAMTHHRNSRPMPRFRRLLRWALIAFAAAVLLGGLALATLYFVVSAKLPDVQTLRHVEMQEPMYVYARDGRLMALFGETRPYRIDIAAVPKRLKQAS